MVYNVEESACLSKNETCIFRVVNGSVLTFIGSTGTILSAFTIYCLIKHVKLPKRQNLFLLNLAVSDVLIAMLGLVRGLGIISSKFVGYDSDTHEQNWWCSAYTFIGNTIWMSPMLMLVPLTFDRFIALVVPMWYEPLMHTKNCKILIAVAWVILSAPLITDTVLISTGSEMVYQASYHRCIFEIDHMWKKITFVLLPFLAIIIMYALMLFFVKRAKIETKKLLIMTTLIIATGLIAQIPDQLLIAFRVRMSYEVAQVTTVTFWYINSILNPIIYFGMNKQTQKNLADTKVGQKISNVARRLSTVSDSDVSVVIARRLSSSEDWHTATIIPMQAIVETPDHGIN